VTWRAVAHKDSPTGLAIAAAALGNGDRAFEALERLATVHPHNVGRLLICPEMQSLKRDPRLASLRKRLKLPVS
jgi:hypothetical protein